MPNKQEQRWRDNSGKSSYLNYLTRQDTGYSSGSYFDSHIRIQTINS